MDLRSVKWMIIMTAISQCAKQYEAHDVCSNYQELNDLNRAAGVRRHGGLRCDRRFMKTPRWYRFTGASGSQMATSCVPKNHCGTHAPGWLSTPHPTRLQQVVTGKVCFHWGGSCCRWKASIRIKKCNGFFIYRLVNPLRCWLRYCGNGQFDECSHYKELNDRERAAGTHRVNLLKCDSKDLETPHWYRFTRAAGSRMPTSCVPKHHCGTHAPGWLNTSHPTTIGQIVDGKVCFHWAGSCCYWHSDIKVKKCNGFYVYKLEKTPVCWLRYCGNAGFDPCKFNNPCKNEATCTAVNDGYSCLCKPGYKGRNCEHDVDECLTRPCLNSGTCENLQGSYSCKCKEGFLGKHCDSALNECLHYKELNDPKRAAGVKRGNVLKCDSKDLATPEWYRFTGAAGNRMPTSCVQKHRCGTHAPGWLNTSHPTTIGQIVDGKVCFHWAGSCCHWHSDIKVKKCNGFYVYKLEKTPVCWLRYCGNAGFDPCKFNNPCKNEATCTGENDGYFCLCKPGYKGRNCEHDVDECLTRPCQNGGTCENLHGSYGCKCRNGFLGKHCEIVFDECTHYEELNGRERAAGVHRGGFLECDRDNITTPKWFRFTGLAGSRMPTSCVPVHHCGTHAPGWLSDPHPTSNGQIVDHTKVCFHWGGNCCRWHANIKIKKCNGGFFVYRLVRTPVCTLRYCGNANFDPCNMSSPCKNGGTCVTESDGYTCLCEPGYKGRNCQTDVDECLARPCLNGGTCENLPGSYKCNCQKGFVGQHCETVFDACLHYRVLNDSDRAAGVQGNKAKCDQQDLVTPDWYRFTGAAGNEMPTSCVPENRCGTQAAGWFGGSHPKMVGQVVSGKVCFHWAGNCCRWRATIKVKRCADFFVYELVRAPACALRYCGNLGYDECQVNSPCKNGASCVPGNGSYTCLCKPGYNGNDCEKDVDECTSSPCKNNRPCINTPGSYQCNCGSGFEGKFCEQDIDECQTYPCANAGICINNPGGYECICQSGFTGKDCEEDIDECQTYPCANAGICINNPGGYECICQSGFTGKDCEVDVDECKSNPCKNNGSCTNSAGSYQCNCSLGFSGEFCDQDINECAATNPCQNGGICINQMGGYECDCSAGFTGDDCESDVDECESSPCKNNGSCTNSAGSYQCTCSLGFSGEFCDQDINECAGTNPCQNGGICINKMGSYECNCSAGFTGDDCESDVDECQAYPCVNEGTCLNNPGSYKCTCSIGFTGRDCETDVDEYKSNPCKNNGSCINSAGSYQCNCSLGFSGDDCWSYKHLDECKNSPCHNKGTCVNSPGSYKCDCRQGFQGEHCEQDVDECGSSPCHNSGICSNAPGNYTCKCLQGFEGKDCEKDEDECANGNPCQNNGTCQNKLGSYSCECPQGFDGHNCEDKKNYIAMGCYKDSASDRVFSMGMLKNLRPSIDWRDISKTIFGCSEIARRHSLKYFAIQYYGECWGGPDGVQYDKYGPGNNCWNGVGGANTNFVYELS